MWFVVWCLGLMRILRHCYVEREDFGYFGSVFLARISDENEQFNPSYISLISIPNFGILYLQPHSSNGQSLYSSGPPCRYTYVQYKDAVWPGGAAYGLGNTNEGRFTTFGGGLPN
jgi:hypothetical protein